MEYETVKCTVVRHDSSKLGMKLTGSGAPYLISMISNDGAAAASGLAVDDRVIMIDDKDVSRDIPLAFVVKAITSSQQEVTITVRRPISANALNEDSLVCEGSENLHESNTVDGPTEANTNDSANMAEKQSPEACSSSNESCVQQYNSKGGFDEQIHETKNMEDNTTDTDIPSDKFENDVSIDTQESNRDSYKAVDKIMNSNEEASETDCIAVADHDILKDGANAAGNTFDSYTKILEIGSFSKHGTRHGDMNQDVPFSYHGKINDKEVSVIAVFDGHGLLGEIAAQVACDALDYACKNNSLPVEQLHGDPTTAMSSIFEDLNCKVIAAHDKPPETYVYVSGTTELNFELIKDASSDLGDMYICPEHEYMAPRPIDFGCTAVIAIIYCGMIIIGNAGDADAIVLQRNCSDDDDARDGFLAKSYTSKHTASTQSEIERVEHDFPGAAIFTPDGYIAPTDPSLSQYELQLTRSLGHKLLRSAGLISTPEVQTIVLDRNTAYGIVVCSDGVTDELQPHDILDRVVQSCNADEAATQLCQDAQQYCMDENKIDDATAVVLLFDTSRDTTC